MVTTSSCYLNFLLILLDRRFLVCFFQPLYIAAWKQTWENALTAKEQNVKLFQRHV